jgi:hypothetical protein
MMETPKKVLDGTDNICSACEYHGRNAAKLAQENETLRAKIDALTHMIEYHCRGEQIPWSLEEKSPHLARLLNEDWRKNDPHGLERQRIELEGLKTELREIAYAALQRTGDKP